jgi:low temperature requirement protein LtrA
VVTWSSFSFNRLRGSGAVRDPGEAERAATPLELLFDLTFVVAVSRAAAALHHGLVEGHVATGVAGFGAVFFAVWWAWMNYTWFSSAHDSDDVAHRLLTLVQMTGVLILAVGVSPAADHGDFRVVVLGYVVMRCGLVAAWLRVARDQPSNRVRALRYALGIVVLQVLWVARLALPDRWPALSFLVLVVGELAVPVWAERASPEPLFHPGHIAERYGLFTVIVLGESILSATVGFEAALDLDGFSAALAAVGFGGVVIAFAAWWLYFNHPGHLAPTPAQGFTWGYSHIVVFAALAAGGAGLAVAAEAITGPADDRVAALAVAIPVALFLAGLALLLVLTGRSPGESAVTLKLTGAAAALAIGLVAPVAVAVVGCAAVLTALTLLMVLTAPEQETASAESAA